jgi:hypothetical protein
MHISTLILENSLWNLLIRFIINLAVLVILVGGVYYRFSKKAEYLFSFFLMGIMIFLICSILGSIDLHMGMAVGMFAVFAIIRFRPVMYSVKDITYVFIIIGISVINSQATIPPPILGAVLINASIIFITYILELFLQKKAMSKLTIIYNKPELLKPGFNKELIKDLTRLTGHNIEKVKIRRMKIRKNNAEIDVFYKESIDEDQKSTHHR